MAEAAWKKTGGGYIASQADQTLSGTDANDAFRSNGKGTTMIGGAGDDMYYVASTADKIIETANGGKGDTVSSWLSYSLPTNVENLILTAASTYGVGNELDNHLTGSAGSQTLFGGLGNDILTGGADDDIFVTRPGTGNDTITDFQAGAGDGDRARLDGTSYTSFDQVKSHLKQVGNDTVLDLGNGQTLTFQGHKVSDFAADDFMLKLDTSSLKLTFDDEFNSLSRYSEGGTWRTTYWGPSSNYERELYTDAGYAGSGTKSLGLNPYSIDNGVLTITAAPIAQSLQGATWGRDYSSGELSSKFTFTQTYGYFEMKAELPEGKGFWPAFWLLPADGSWPPELDVMEQLGGDASQIYNSAHSLTGGVHTADIAPSWVGDTSDGMHTYGVSWDSHELIYYFDGVEVARHQTPADMNKPMYLIVNLAVGGWAGDPDAGATAQMKVDYVRAYQWSESTDAPTSVPPSSSSSSGAANAQASTLQGTSADDLFVVNDSNIKIVEPLHGGIDTVRSSISYTLGANIENLILAGTAAIDGTGNALNNTINGNDAANHIDGGLGNDKMIGGGGDDIYHVDSVGDVVIEAGNGGNDTVMSSITFRLPENVENITLTGLANINGSGNGADNVIIGNDGNNYLEGGVGNDVLTGGKGNDVLDGGTGSNTLTGGTGNDIYIVSSTADTVIEKANEGIDLVKAMVSYALAENIENLTLGGNANINGTGNALNNTLIGNGGNNTLDGAGGNDYLASGGGHTSLFGGTGDDVLRGTSSSEIFDGGTGNDRINADAGNDVIRGGAGNDLLTGGFGADQFVFNVTDVGSGTTRDQIFDFEGAGVSGGDVLVFDGFSAHSTLRFVSMAGAMQQYELTDRASGAHEALFIASANGHMLTTSDYMFT